VEVVGDLDLRSLGDREDGLLPERNKGKGTRRYRGKSAVNSGECLTGGRDTCGASLPPPRLPDDFKYGVRLQTCTVLGAT
jgi:hypothetical protein